MFLKDLFKEKNFIITGLVVVLLVFFLFGFFHIDKFETTDEHFWIKEKGNGRIQDYWNAIEKINLSDTRINDKPGVSLALVSGWPLFFNKHFGENDNAPSFMTPFRTTSVLFIGFFSFYFYWALKRLLSKRTALLWLALLYLSPVVVGISQILNPDSLIWLFSFATFISWLLFLEKNQKIDLILGALFLALAILSKYSALILIPFLFILSLIYFFKKPYNQDDLERIKIISYFWLYLFLMFIFFSLLMPSVFVKYYHIYYHLVYFKEMLFIYLGMVIISLLIIVNHSFFKIRISFISLKKIKKGTDLFFRICFFGFFLASLLIIFNWTLLKNNFLGLAHVPFDISQGPPFSDLMMLNKLILEIKPLIYSLTPLVLIFFIASTLYFCFRKKEINFIAATTFLFIGFYYLAALQQGLLLHPRYSISIYPFVALFTAIAINKFSLKKYWLFIFIFLIIFFAQMIGLWKIKPFYLAYANIFLPKNEIISNSWGYGGYEAAEFLNSLPNAKEKAIFSDDSVTCKFFIGECVEGNSIKSSEIKDQKIFDYYVKTRRGSINSKVFWRITSRKMPTLYKNQIWSLRIGNRNKNFINIYKYSNKK